MASRPAFNDTKLMILGCDRTEIVGKNKFSNLLTPKTQKMFKDNLDTINPL
jgi:hypothetical protein